jgi:hypothetical protein
MPSRLLLWTVVVLLITVGVGIVRKQRTAVACPLHRRWVGGVAIALAATSFAAAAVLAVYVWLM